MRIYIRLKMLISHRLKLVWTPLPLLYLPAVGIAASFLPPKLHLSFLPLFAYFACIKKKLNL